MFVERFARHFTRRYAMQPMVSRVFAWLLVCDPPNPSVAEIAESLAGSRSAISSAVASLERWGWVQRTRPPGQRFDRVKLDPDIWLRVMDSEADYAAVRNLAKAGLDVLEDAPLETRARLLELQHFTEFLLERMPRLHAEWQAERERLRASWLRTD